MSDTTLELAESSTEVRLVLNAGCGSAAAARLHPGFGGVKWREIRLDIDAAVRPDIVASLTDMREHLVDDSVDAVWSSHCIEHLHTHEVIPALREFRRVLRPTGFAIVVCPDLRAITRFALDSGVETVAYMSAAGPVRPLDMIYGHARSIAAGLTHMAHNTGFTSDRLGRVALEAGFTEVRVIEGGAYDLWGALVMPEADRAALAKQFCGTSAEALFSPP